MNWIVDDFGKVHRSGAVELSRSLGYTSGGTSVETYAIENIGHVGIADRGTRVHIRCRPALMAERAISGLLYWLLDRGSPQVVVSWLDDVWRLEPIMPCQVAITFICHLVDKRTLGAAVAGPRLLSRPSTNAQRRWTDVASALSGIVTEDCDAGARRRVLDTFYYGRWTIVDVNLQTKQAKMVDRGDGYPPLGPHLVGRKNNFDFKDIADTDYRNWLHDTFYETAISDKATFDDVDAIITWPRTGDTRMRYWRIVAPLMRDDGLSRLLSVSGSDSSIDLRPHPIQVAV